MLTDHHKKVRPVNCSGLDSVRLGLVTPDPSTKVKVPIQERCFSDLGLSRLLKKADAAGAYRRHNMYIVAHIQADRGVGVSDISEKNYRMPINWH